MESQERHALELVLAELGLNIDVQAYLPPDAHARYEAESTTGCVIYQIARAKPDVQ